MDIGKFSPQTQQTLRRLDTNQDQQLSARELHSLTAAAKQGKPLPGIAPEDHNQVRQALLKAASGAPLVLNLVDAPLVFPAQLQFPDKDFAADKSLAQKLSLPQAVVEADTQIKLIPQIKPAQDNTPGRVEGLAVQASGDWGLLKLEGKGLASQARTNHASSSATPVGVPPIEEMPTDRFDLRGEAALGDLKVKAQGLLNEQQQLGNLSTELAYQFLPSHGLRVQAKAPEADGLLSWGSLELGSSHKFGALSLNTNLYLDEQGKPGRYGLGASYQLLPDHGFRVQAKPQTENHAPLSWNSLEVGSSHKLGDFSFNTRAQLDGQGKPNLYGAGVSYQIFPGAKLEAEAGTDRQVRIGGSMRFTF